jgi:hypothetical protein
MGQSMDSATAHIACYVRDIWRSEGLRRAVLQKRAELLQTRRAASALVGAGGAGAGEDDRVDRKRHNVTINAKGAVVAAVYNLMYEKDTLKNGATSRRPSSRPSSRSCRRTRAAASRRS